MMLPALPDPTTTTVVVLHEHCASVCEWMDQTDDVAQLNEVRHWLSAVEEYLESKKAQGPAQTAARLLEARMGDLLGPPRESPGRPPKGEEMTARRHSVPRQEAREFWMMADRRGLWMDKLPLPRRRVLRLIRDDDADMRPPIERPAELLTDIRQGDFREVLSDIPDESVDLILTDPPYPAEFLPLWSDLGAFARRVLSPSGVLAAMSGQSHLPDVYARLGEHLRYRWTMAYLMTGAWRRLHPEEVA